MRKLPHHVFVFFPPDSGFLLEAAYYLITRAARETQGAKQR